MKASRFNFNVHEFAGAFGDLGTLLPFVIGFIAVCGLDAAALLISLGICNLLCSIIFRVPIPLQPMKLIAVVAIAGQWTPAMLYACGIATGIVWTILGLTRAMTILGHYTPAPVIKGIQAALGTLLGYKAFELIQTQWLLAILSILLIIVCSRSRRVPAALMLMLMAAIVIWLKKDVSLNIQPHVRLPELPCIAFDQIWDVMLQAGFAQLPLTATNAVIATAALTRSYWPESPVSEKKLSLSIGLFNLGAPFTGGMPVCHGAGGLAAQYAFGARTCGTKIIEGAVMLATGLLLADSIAALLTAFPGAILGTMLLLVAFELIKPACAARTRKDLTLLAITFLSALLINMAVGFMTGIGLNAVWAKFTKLKLEKKAWTR
jgi:MFS superfamily sulfate permease-like transporter